MTHDRQRTESISFSAQSDEVVGCSGGRRTSRAYRSRGRLIVAVMAVAAVCMTVVVISAAPAQGAGALRGATIRFSLESGAPIAGAAISWTAVDGSGRSSRALTTDASGAVRFDAIPVGDVSFSLMPTKAEPIVWRPGLASLLAVRQWFTTVPASGDVLVTLPEPRVFSARVAVLTPDGQPVAGARPYVGETKSLDMGSRCFWGPACGQVLEWHIMSVPCGSGSVIQYTLCGGVQHDPMWDLVADETGTVAFPFFAESAIDTCVPQPYMRANYCEWLRSIRTEPTDIVVSLDDGAINQRAGANLRSAGDTVLELPYMPRVRAASPSVQTATSGTGVTITVAAADGAGNPVPGASLTLGALNSSAAAKRGTEMIAAAGACTPTLTATTNSAGEATFSVCAGSPSTYVADGPTLLSSSPVCVTAATTAPQFTPLPPVRLFDSRDLTAGAIPVLKKKVGGAYEMRVRVLGAGGVPMCEPVGAVSLNVTVTEPSGSGFVTVYPCGGRPLASNLNFVSGQTVPNAVIVPVSAQGEICVFASAGTHVLADVNGWFATPT